MREALFIFGNVTVTGAGNTYCADELNLGTVSAKYRRTLHALGHRDDLWVRFVCTTATAVAGTSIAPAIYADTTTAPTVVVAQGKAYATDSVAIPIGTIHAIHFPVEVPQYIRAGYVCVGSTTTGVFNGSAVTGPNIF